MLPLYMGITDAAKYAGIGRDALFEFVNSVDPPPYLLIGKRKYIQVAELATYLERKQEVRNVSK